MTERRLWLPVYHNYHNDLLWTHKTRVCGPRIIYLNLIWKLHFMLKERKRRKLLISGYVYFFYFLFFFFLNQQYFSIYFSFYF